MSDCLLRFINIGLNICYGLFCHGHMSMNMKVHNDNVYCTYEKKNVLMLMSMIIYAYDA